MKPCTCMVNLSGVAIQLSVVLKERGKASPSNVASYYYYFAQHYIINVLKSWTAVNGADVSNSIGMDTATVSQVCSPTCESPRLSFESNSGVQAVAAGTFIGGLIGGIILVAIPVVVVW